MASVAAWRATLTTSAPELPGVRSASLPARATRAAAFCGEGSVARLLPLDNAGGSSAASAATSGCSGCCSASRPSATQRPVRRRKSSARSSRLGGPTKMALSRRPGRSRAGSTAESTFVAARTKTRRRGVWSAGATPTPDPPRSAPAPFASATASRLCSSCDVRSAAMRSAASLRPDAREERRPKRACVV